MTEQISNRNLFQKKLLINHRGGGGGGGRSSSINASSPPTSSFSNSTLPPCTLSCLSFPYLRLHLIPLIFIPPPLCRHLPGSDVLTNFRRLLRNYRPTFLLHKTPSPTSPRRFLTILQSDRKLNLSSCKRRSRSRSFWGRKLMRSLTSFVRSCKFLDPPPPPPRFF